MQQKSTAGNTANGADAHCYWGMVPLAGVEPARPQRRLILSQVRLPIPPQRHVDTERNYIIIAFCVCQQIS